MTEWGPSTRAVRAGVPEAVQGDPLAPGPVFAAPYHLAGEASHTGYGRDHNPTWSALESAIGSLDGGECVVFASGMAAASAVLEPRLGPGDAVVVTDGYFGVGGLARERLVPRGVDVRQVRADTDEVLAALPGARLVWIETPSNPLLTVVDIRAVAGAARAQGALLAVDNTLATPLGQQPLALGADFAMVSATKSISGHSDVLGGAVSVRDAALADELRHARTRGGAILGPLEAWVLHRSLAELELRLTRQSDNALAVAELLRDHPAVEAVHHPSDHPLAHEQMRRFGALVGFTLASTEAAQTFLARCELVAEATSFGGVHSSAERRGRWGTDPVPDGFIRFSAGIEDTADLLGDVQRALA